MRLFLPNVYTSWVFFPHLVISETFEINGILHHH